MEKSMELGQLGIVVSVDEESGKGWVYSELHETFDPEVMDEDEIEEMNEYNHRLDGLESLILACACSGVDIQSPEFVQAVKTAIDACANN